MGSITYYTDRIFNEKVNTGMWTACKDITIIGNDIYKLEDTSSKDIVLLLVLNVPSNNKINENGNMEIHISEKISSTWIPPFIKSSVDSYNTSTLFKYIKASNKHDITIICCYNMLIPVDSKIDGKTETYRMNSEGDRKNINDDSIILEKSYKFNKTLYPNTKIKITDYMNHIIERVNDTDTLKAVFHGLHNHLCTESEDVDPRKDGIKIIHCYNI